MSSGGPRTQRARSIGADAGRGAWRVFPDRGNTRGGRRWLRVGRREVRRGRPLRPVHPAPQGGPGGTIPDGGLPRAVRGALPPPRPVVPGRANASSRETAPNSRAFFDRGRDLTGGRARPLRVDAIYYDARGMHNRGELEFSVFDAPRGVFDSRHHSLYRADFVTYLLSAEGRVFWKVEWSQVARSSPAGGDKNDDGVNVAWSGQEWARRSEMDLAELRARGVDIWAGYESIRGGPASGFEGECAENVWLVGYTTEDPRSTVFLPAISINTLPFGNTLQYL
mmetsp:Transcript_35153/g.104937  ORF Transcript_35153/g.104937 Transcript_35153/m.104937 type:complete len:281 (+) Transcript_35153:473-1315(+)